jgi:hypothetical protein
MDEPPAPTPTPPNSGDTLNAAIEEMAFKSLVEFFSHLPRDGNLDLSLLKGHLLIEQRLNDLISRDVQHPKFLPDLRFLQKMQLVRANNARADETWIWEALAKLNKARNELSHSLAKEKLEAKVEEFVRFVESHKNTPSPDLATERFGRFHFALFTVHMVLTTDLRFGPHMVKIPNPLCGAPTLLAGGASRPPDSFSSLLNPPN